LARRPWVDRPKLAQPPRTCKLGDWGAGALGRWGEQSGALMCPLLGCLILDAAHPSC